MTASPPALSPRHLVPSSPGLDAAVTLDLADLRPAAFVGGHSSAARSSAGQTGQLLATRNACLDVLARWLPRHAGGLGHVGGTVA